MGFVDTLLGRKAPDQEFDIDLSDPYVRDMVAGWINVSGTGLPNVTESDAFGIPSFSRGVELIAGTIATLPLRTYRDVGGVREVVPSVFDKPQGPYGISAFQWYEMVYYHLVVYREAFLRHVYNGAGALVGFWPVHPGAITRVEWSGPRKVFTLTGGEQLSDTQMTHVMGPNAYGLRGVPLFTSHRRTFQTAIAGESAAGRSFTGALVAGMVTTVGDDDVDPDTDGKVIREELNRRVMGTENAGSIAFVNRELKFTPWFQTNADAQFIESRQYQTEEFARMLGLPPHLLAAIDKQTSWGTGVAEQNLGLARYCLTLYTSRFESAMSALLPDSVFIETDYKGLLQGSPAEEIGLLLAQTGAPILSVDEARHIQNRGPMPVAAVPDAPSQEVSNG